MYREHVPQIAAAMREDPRIFERGVMFAVLSARTKFVRAEEQMRDLEDNGRGAASLWGWKFDSYDYLSEHAGALWLAARDCRDPVGAIAGLCKIPGLGIVKAGFVCQLMGFDVGCLDTRNIERLGLNPEAYASQGAAYKARPSFRRKIESYVAETGGRAEELWDGWCAYMAKGVSADEISRRHLAIIPKNKRRAYVNRRENMPCIPCRSDIPL